MFIKVRNNIFYLLILLATKSQILAEEPSFSSESINLYAKKSISYQDGNKTVVAQDNASLQSKNILLLADTIIWDREVNRVQANGLVSLNYFGTRMLADELTFFIESGDYHARNVRGGTVSFLFEAESIQKKGDFMELNKSEIYHSDPSPLTLNLSVENTQVDLNRSSLTAHSIDLNVGDFLVGKLPKLSGGFDNKDMHLQPHIGFGKEGSLGWYTKLGLSKRSRNLEGDAYVKMIEARGILLSPSLAWEANPYGNYHKGRLNGDWIRQNHRIEFDRRGQVIDQERAQVHLSSINRVNKNLRIASVIDWETDSDFKRDYKREIFADHQWNKSFAEISHTSDWGTLSLFSEWQSNEHESITEQTPVLSFISGPSKFLQVYHSSSVHWGMLKDADEFGQKGPSVERIDLGYGIEKPILLHQGIVLTPSWDVRQRIEEGSNSDSDQIIGGFGADLNFELHRKFDLNSTFFDFDKILHSTSFSIAFRDKNVLSSGNTNSLPLGQISHNYNFESIDLLDHSQSDWFKPYRVVRVSWANGLHGIGKQNASKLASTRMYIDLSGRTPELTTQSRFFYSELSITPWSWISVNYANKYDLEQHDHYKQKVGITVLDGRFQELFLGYSKYKNFNDFAEFSGWKRINEKTLITLSGRYDLSTKQSTHLGSTLSYLTQGNWVIELSVDKRRGTLRENSTEWKIGATLSSF